MENPDLAKRYEKLKVELEKLVTSGAFGMEGGSKEIESYVRGAILDAKKYVTVVAKYGNLITSEDRKSLEGLCGGEVEAWYKKNCTALGNEHRNRLKAAFYEKYLEIFEKNFGIHVEVRRRGEMIRSGDDLVKAITEDANIAQYIADIVWGNERDCADLIAVVYAGRITPDLPTIRGYIHPIFKHYFGKTTPPKKGDKVLPPLFTAAKKLMPYDPGKAVIAILKKRLIEYRRECLGTNPSEEDFANFKKDLKEIKEELGCMKE